MTAVDIRRFARFNGNNRWLHDRVGEVLGLHYAIPWPNRELATARPFRRSPVHHLLAEADAVLRQPDGLGARRTSSPRRARRRSSSTPGARRTGCPGGRRAARRPAPAVAVFDQTSFSKYLLTGPEREQALQWLCTADVAVPPGRTVYTGMLNERGTYESDLTVTRLSADRVPAGQQRRHHRARQGPHPPHGSRRAPAHARRCDVGVLRLRRHGAEVAGPAGRACPAPTCPTRASRSAPAARSTSATTRCGRPGSPTWASSAGSCTSRPSSRSGSTRT